MEKDALLVAVYQYLGYAEEPDAVTLSNIKGYIARGRARLKAIAGHSLDFDAEEMPRALLFDYCRYANSQALEVFEKNFRSELLELSFSEEVQSSADQNTD